MSPDAWTSVILSFYVITCFILHFYPFLYLDFCLTRLTFSITIAYGEVLWQPFDRPLVSNSLFFAQQGLECHFAAALRLNTCYKIDSQLATTSY